jgi:hypothetical protein
MAEKKKRGRQAMVDGICEQVRAALGMNTTATAIEILVKNGERVIAEVRAELATPQRRPRAPKQPGLL